jgi:hypothetical protein
LPSYFETRTGNTNVLILDLCIYIYGKSSWTEAHIHSARNGCVGNCRDITNSDHKEIEK